jgi:predicted regulator of Ras-like GTPase activity (Roadblock/LC7/MglB family)
MGELSQIRNALDEIKGIEHVMDVSLVSRGGMYILGDPTKGVHQETYAAMAAIMLGAGETSSAEMKDVLRHIVIRQMERSLILVGAGTRYLLAIVTDTGADDEKVADGAKQIISKVEINI